VLDFGDFETPLEIKGISLRPSEMLGAVTQRNMERRGVDIQVQESHKIHLAIGQGRAKARRSG
jgi:hypothetical protein